MDALTESSLPTTIIMTIKRRLAVALACALIPSLSVLDIVLHPETFAEWFRQDQLVLDEFGKTYEELVTTLAGGLIDHGRNQQTQHFERAEGTR